PPRWRDRDYQTFNLSPPCKGGRPCPLRSLDREGAPQAVVAGGLFRIPKGFKCGERREAGRGAGVHAPQAELTFRTYCRQLYLGITSGLSVIRAQSRKALLVVSGL